MSLGSRSSPPTHNAPSLGSGSRWAGRETGQCVPSACKQKALNTRVGNKKRGWGGLDPERFCRPLCLGFPVLPRPYPYVLRPRSVSGSGTGRQAGTKEVWRLGGPRGPQSVAFGENQGQAGRSPVQPLLLTEKVSTDAGPRPCRPTQGRHDSQLARPLTVKGRISCVAPGCAFLLLPAPRPGTELLAGSLARAAPVPMGQPLVWPLKPCLSPGTSLDFSSPSFLPQDDRSLRGLTTRPRAQGP